MRTSRQPGYLHLTVLETPVLAFQIVEPSVIGFNWLTSFALSDAENAILQSPAEEDVVVMQVLYKKRDRR